MSKQVLIVFVFCVTIDRSFQDPMQKSNGKRCTQFDKRSVFTSCVLDYLEMTLWCDQTNFTTVPAPQTVKAYAAPQLARKLFMNDSCISVIRSGDLGEYTALETFDCSSNPLTAISRRAFTGLVKLKALNLMNNRLKELEDDVFADLESLQILHLDRNKLHHIQSQVFQGLLKLEKLTAQHNRLRAWIHPQARLGRLKFLELDNNQIEKLSPHNFRGMKSLMKITLSRNALQFVEAGTFDGNPRLRYIDLRNNKLGHLPQNLFAHLCDLSELYLGGNQLVTPHPQWFLTVLRNVDNLDGFTENSISDNLWSCDSNATDYWEFLIALSKDKVYSSTGLHTRFNLRCYFPSDIAGHMLTNLSRSQLTNKSEPIEQNRSGKTTNQSEPTVPNNLNVTEPQKLQETLTAVSQQCRKQMRSHRRSVPRMHHRSIEKPAQVFIAQSKHSTDQNQSTTKFPVILIFVAVPCALLMLVVIIALNYKHFRKQEKKRTRRLSSETKSEPPTYKSLSVP